MFKGYNSGVLYPRLLIIIVHDYTKKKHSRIYNNMIVIYFMFYLILSTLLHNYTKNVRYNEYISSINMQQVLRKIFFLFYPNVMHLHKFYLRLFKIRTVFLPLSLSFEIALGRAHSKIDSVGSRPD